MILYYVQWMIFSIQYIILYSIVYTYIYIYIAVFAVSTCWCSIVTLAAPNVACRFEFESVSPYIWKLSNSSSRKSKALMLPLLIELLVKDTCWDACWFPRWLWGVLVLVSQFNCFKGLHMLGAWFFYFKIDFCRTAWSRRNWGFVTTFW